MSYDMIIGGQGPWESKKALPEISGAEGDLPGIY